MGADGAKGDEGKMAEYLRREKVDVVVACDFARPQLEAINDAVRKAGSMFFSAGSYGFYGYIFADLGPDYENVARWVVTSNRLTQQCEPWGRQQSAREEPDDIRPAGPCA